MGTILVGATSWTDKTLIASHAFYPPEVKSAEARLRFYASRFSIVEVDSTYYGLPSEHNALLWAQRTPPGFVFNIKAFRLFTHHQTPRDALPPDLRREIDDESRNVYYDDLAPAVVDEMWARFRSALAPLRASGKLGVLLFQFPPWFVYRPAHLTYLAECSARLPGDRIAVEWRNKSWLDERHMRATLDFEREHRLAHVVVDEPQGFAGSVPTIWEVTASDIAVVRLHGRNSATWQKKSLDTAAQRFDYLYTEEELRAFVDPVRRLAQRAETVHVLFNNCNRDYAPRNALQLRGMLSV